MWLNLIFLSLASLAVGFVLGWFVASPRRWTARFDPAPADRTGAADDLPPLTRTKRA
nr:hypothetical protein GCM10010200_075110 [Actinomadura rugatobispora]